MDAVLRFVNKDERICEAMLCRDGALDASPADLDRLKDCCGQCIH